MSFAQRLDELMGRTGTTMYKLAKALNVHQTTIKNWLTEHTEPKKQELLKMAEYFNVSTDELLGIEKAPAEGEGVDEDDIKVALFGGDGEVTDEMWEEVKQFAEFIKERERNKR